MTVTEALDRFLVQLEADGRSPHTIGQYRRHVRLLAVWLASDGRSLEIESIGHQDLARFLASDVARLKADAGPKKATSMNALRSSIKGFFRHLHGAEYIERDPSRLIRRALCSPPPPRALTDDEQQRLIVSVEAAADSFEAQRDLALFRVLLGTGLRLSSALALRVEDVDLAAREVEIRSAKGDRPDRLPVSTAVAKILKAWIVDRREGVLFPRRDGEAITSRHAQRRFREWLHRAGITRPASPHSCRHAFALRVLSRSGGDLSVVQAALRHRSITSTLVYARADTERLRAAIG